MYVLISAYEDSGVVPVQLEVKEFLEKDNSLYVAVTLHKIKDAVVATESAQSSEAPARAVRISTISLRDLFANINPKEGVHLVFHKFFHPFLSGVLRRPADSWRYTADLPHP